MRVRATRLSAAALVQDYAGLAETVAPASLPAPAVTRDPDDDHVLACALAADAKLSSPAMHTFSSSRATTTSRSAQFPPP